MTVLIPAYEPDERLNQLVQEIICIQHFNIVVVDDGSGQQYSALFDRLRGLGCCVLTHQVNQGKGRALKTGFDYILQHTDEKEGVITADADGQHLVKDILLIASAFPVESNQIVLGVRKFIGNVPFRSVVGNTITRKVFKLASGYTLEDTQTGLRGFPVSMLPWLMEVAGERFEYEMQMLLEASTAGYELIKLNIETIYLQGNQSSHFRTIHDSILVFLPFLKFCISGFTAAFVDYILLLAIQRITNNLLLSVITARVVSSGVNFAINSTQTFRKKHPHPMKKSEAGKYYALVCVLLALNYLILRFLTENAGIPLFWSKLITELFLFGFSYSIQRFYVFRKRYQQV